MSVEHPLLKVCHKFLDPIEIKGDEVEGLIKDGQIYLKFLDSITKVGYSYSTRGSYSIGPEKLDDLPEGYKFKLHFDRISGLPYTISKCVKMQCKFGTNYYGSKKLDDPEKKKRNYVSKKIGCESRLNIKMRHMFINKRYRNALKKTAWRRRKIAMELHERMKSTHNRPLNTIWYHISLSVTHCHPPEGVEETETDNDLEADNSNLVFHEVEIQTTSTAPELKTTLRELLMDTIGMTYNLPEDEGSVENIKDLIFQASSLKSTIKAVLNPNEAKKPPFQSFVKRKRIKRTVDTLQKEARIRDDKWDIPSGKKRKVKEYKSASKQSIDESKNVEVDKTTKDGTSKVEEESLEDGLSLLEKEMLEASKRAEEALLKDNTIETEKELTELEEPFLEENVSEEGLLVENVYTGKEEFIAEDMYNGEEAPTGEEMYTQELEEENEYIDEEQFLGEDMYTEEESLVEEEVEPPAEEQQQQPKEVKVLKVSSVWGGYLNVELVSVNASELTSTQYNHR